MGETMSQVPAIELNTGARIPQLGFGVFQIPSAQVVLCCHIQREDIVFPKSVTPERRTANFALFDFELGSSDMDAITALDKGEAGRTASNSDDFDYIPK
jgi:diketogulonate reductase-like aldo/keto reductase